MRVFHLQEIINVEYRRRNRLDRGLLESALRRFDCIFYQISGSVVNLISQKAIWCSRSWGFGRVKWILSHEWWLHFCRNDYGRLKFAETIVLEFNTNPSKIFYYSLTVMQTTLPTGPINDDPVVKLLLTWLNCSIFSLYIFPSDINECESPANGCDVNADCFNIAGSYRCRCRLGYQGNGSHCVCELLSAMWILSFF